MSPRIVLFNGPPHSGKDTVAKALAMQLDAASIRVQLVAFSMPMRLAVAALLGKEYSLKWYEEEKDKVQELSNRTIREMMIDLSEGHVKPSYGNDYWVKAALAGVDPNAQIVLVTDCGFFEELAYLYFNRNPLDHMLVRLERDGTDWSKDSRKPLRYEAFHEMILENNGKVQDAATKIRYVMKSIGWLASKNLER
jgi:hypothetical protein